MENPLCVVDIGKVGEIIRKVKKLAKEYKTLTKKSLGITGEVAEYEAARLIGLQLCEARQPGYDAIKVDGSATKRVQIKGRCSSNYNPGSRVGNIRFTHEWDIVMLVLMDENFEPLEIYEADRAAISRKLKEPGSRARNERGSLGVAQFKSISKKIWQN
jgi:hypothetical protein